VVTLKRMRHDSASKSILLTQTVRHHKVLATTKDLTRLPYCIYAQVIENMGLKTEIIALTFGALLILLTFGDSHLVRYVGNLDTTFGLTFWKLLDVLYPLVSIVVFLLYGKVKGGLRFNVVTMLVFLSYLFALALISLDDIVLVLKLQITLSKDYWIAVEWFYPIYSSIAFFIFGRANEVEKTAYQPESPHESK
jgi:hypothetical protein